MEMHTLLLTLQLKNEFQLSFKYRIPGYIWKESQSGNSLDKQKITTLFQRLEFWGLKKKKTKLGALKIEEQISPLLPIKSGGYKIHSILIFFTNQMGKW